MNKFAVVILMAFVAVAACSSLGDELDVESQLALNPSAEDETAGLEGPYQIFADFCINSRDYIIGDIKKNTNGLASNFFGVFFSTATNLGLEAVNVQRDAAEKLGEQIRNPDAAIGDYNHDDEIASIIAEGQKSIQDEQSQPRTLFQGFISTLAATKNAITSNVVGQLNNLKDKWGVATVISSLKTFCDRADQYDTQLQSQFEQYVAALSDPAMKSAKLENVNCLTARRVIRVDGLCKLANAAKNPLLKAFAYKQVSE